MKQWVLKTAKGQRIIVDRDIWRKYKDYKWHITGGGYSMGCLGGNGHYYLHRLIMETPKGMYTDHINGNKLDNRRSNLRIVTHSQNLHGFNTYPNKSGIRGITRGISRGGKYSGRWIAQVTINYVHKYLGSFPTKELAHQAYLQAKSQL